MGSKKAKGKKRVTMPRDFGWRYIGWMLWSNLITVIAIVQAVFATMALAADVFSHNTIRVYMVISAVLSGVVAQIKKNRPPGPPPRKRKLT